MKKFLLLAAMIGVAADASAICPTKLNGVWSGSGVSSNDGALINDGDFDNRRDYHSVTNKLLVIKIIGSTAQPVYYAEASSGMFGESNGGPQVGAPALTIKFDRNTCTGTFQGPDGTGDTVYFVVTERGQTIQTVARDQYSQNFTDNLVASGGIAQALTLHRQ